MGLLDGLIGGIIGGAGAKIVGDIMEKQGGVQGMVKEFQEKGLGDAVKSWIAIGPNEKISSAQVHQALGADTLKAMAAKSGMSVDDLAAKLAEYLPKAVDKMTPDGKLPS
jgi:uncharacterized protein YidB (DUF937 family)